jgi:peptide/nickel transport system permease protein
MEKIAMEEMKGNAPGLRDIGPLKDELKKEQRKVVLRRFLRNRTSAAGALILVFMIVCAALAPLVCPEGPYVMVMSERLSPPSIKHLFGTDAFGRDLFARILYGARISMLIGGTVSLASLASGLVIGLYAAYYRGLDNVLMRLCDSVNAIPATLLAIALMAVLGASTANVVASLSVIYTPALARVARASALSVKESLYIESMRALGAKPRRIIWRHILPNIVGPVIVQASFIFANAIITEAALSFLGVGVPVPQPSWGNILYEGKSVIYKASWMVVYPGAFTVLAVLGLNLFGDGLRDILNPKGRA